MEASSVSLRPLLAQMDLLVLTTVTGTTVVKGQEKLCHRRHCHCSGLYCPVQILVGGEGTADVS